MQNLTNKTKKFIVVIFLTLLIWASAYLAQEEQIQESATLQIAPRTSENLLVTFVDYESSVPLDITLKGPAAKVADLQRSLHSTDPEKGRTPLTFYYNAESEGKSETGIHDINLLEFLRHNARIRRLGLAVVSVEPETVQIRSEALVERSLSIVCVDESGNPIRHESIRPPQVQMFVRESWTGELLRAEVKLTPAQIERAQQSPILVKPYVRLFPGKEKPRFADIDVLVKLPEPQDLLEDRLLQPPRIGFVFPPSLQGKYKVELANELVTTMRLRATEEAFDAYRQQPYHLLIEVYEGDEALKEEIPREVKYAFPPEYLRAGEIQLSGPPLEPAFIKLVPAASP